MNIDRFVSRIETAYENLGYTLGWRFLYSPVSTLAPSTQLMFVGINPGGGVYEEPIPSVEEGNAYRIEKWNGNNYSSVQREVSLLFNRIAGSLEPKITGATLLDKTLTANFCPFRSSGWYDKRKRLPRQKEAIEFSYDLWLDISQHLRPAVIICMGSPAFEHFRKVFIRRGFQSGHCDKRATGWGDHKYTFETLSLGSDELMILGMPHLSQFKVISSTKCQAQSDEMIKIIADRLNETENLF